MNDETADDSFDAVLASLEIPTAAKIPKRQTNISSAATPKVMDTPALNTNSILVHSTQRGNPILKSITNAQLEFCDNILPDFVVGRTTCVLYLSLKYHNLNPDYICQRLKALVHQYELRVLLVQIDTPEPHNALKSLTIISLLADITMMCAWNAEEAGKIIETYKLFEKRPPDLIMERIESCPHQKLVTALSNIKPVNKTDAVTLLQNFGSLKNVISANGERLSQIVGLGPRKAKQLHKTLQEPFLNQ